MAASDIARNEETKAAAVGLFLFGILRSVELRENFRLIGSGNSEAGILHGRLHKVSRELKRERHTAAGGSVIEGVIQEIGEDQPQVIRISHNRQALVQLADELERNFALAGPGLGTVG